MFLRPLLWKVRDYRAALSRERKWFTSCVGMGMTWAAAPECVCVCEHLSGRGEHGRRVGEDAPSRRRGFFRRRFPGGLAGQQNEAKVPGLEEETAAGQTVGDSEENRLGLSR